MHPMSADAPFDGRVPAPRFANVETTRFCNLRCRMCVQYNDGTTVSGPHMGLDEFERIASALFPHVERWQPSVSGEPLLSRDFTRMLALAEHHGVKAEIYTNGTLLQQPMVDRLVPNVAAVTISFDGASKATFEQIRVGAEFEAVAAGVRRLIASCRARLPADRQPQIGLACVAMASNVRELAQLVRLVKDLGGDFLRVSHVFPVDDAMREQSLARHQELARACIDEALAAAREVGVAFRIEALDQITAQTALGAERRAFATVDGAVAGLEMREYWPRSPAPLPGIDADAPGADAVLQRRAAAATRAGLPPRRAGDPAAPDRGEIWWCEYLWDRTYVAIGGDVRPCCVAGVPVAGNLNAQPFEQLWHDATYRTLRQRLVARRPVAACRGCMHIRRTRDPGEVDRLLLGRRPPAPHELEPLPAALEAAPPRPVRAGEPPVLAWPADPAASRYVLEFSLDGFDSVLFSTDGPRGGPAIRQNRWQVPRWAWQAAPADREVQWRALAQRGGAFVEVGRGAVPAAPTAA